MRAIRYRNYGSLQELELEQVPAPDVGAHQVLVRISHAALNPKDTLLRTGVFQALSGRSFPKFTGLDFAGEVLESRCAGYRPGELVFGFLNEWKGRRGTLAELVAVGRAELSHLPAGVSLEQGAGVALAGTACLQALRDIGHVGPGQRVLIHGASGGVGTSAIQIACLLGATVTTLSSERNRALCQGLGAADARSYEQIELLRELNAYDCVFDVHGSLSAPALRHAMKRGSVFISTTPTLMRLVRSVVTRVSSVRERIVLTKPCEADLQQLARWLGTGQLQAIVETRYPLAQAQQAFAELERNHVRGKVIIEVS
ncbi:MAG: zinc-binding alcohol dehydrogenase [Myxococcaceae bacterium]|nr:zinc-binding alcohol dehydrogenase [Myxococcaceae bacterium]